MKIRPPLLAAVFRCTTATIGCVPLGTSAHAAGLIASDGAASDLFGRSVSLSGNNAVAGAYGDDSYRGSAYVFRNLDTDSGTVPQNVKLTASDGVAYDSFGFSVSLSENTIVTGAYSDDNYRGSAYVFRNLDTASDTVTQNVKLTASDSEAYDRFGVSVSLSGNTAIAGAYTDDGNRGSAYIFRNLDTASGTVTQDVKLTASDGTASDQFGYSVSLSGNTAIAGTYGDDNTRGSAYVFRNLDTATGTVTQNVKLTASDGAANDYFGFSVSLSGNTAVAGVYGDDNYRGSAYVFRNLDTASGTITQYVKLTASDAASNDYFGRAVSLSGHSGLIAAPNDDSGRGSAYLFLNLEAATGTIIQNVKLTASDRAATDVFGISVSLEGDHFLIGASYGNGNVVDSGKAYSGSVSSVTTLDTGNASRTISGISFTSQDDWIVGETTEANSVTLSAGDSANVTAGGKAIYIGKNADSDNNTLTVHGNVTANAVHIGALGNTGNIVLLASGATITTTSGVNVVAGSTLAGSGTIIGDLTAAGTISPGSSPGTLKVQNGDVSLASGSIFNWELLANTESGVDTNYDGLSVTDGGLTIDSNANFRVILNGTADLGQSFWNENRKWTDIFNVTGGSVTSGWNHTSVVAYLANGTPANNSAGSFNITGTTLNWVAVPEPSGGVVSLLLAIGLLSRRRA